VDNATPQGSTYLRGKTVQTNGTSSKELLLGFRQVIFGKYGRDRAFGHAQGTVNTFVGVNGQEIRPFMKTIDRTNVHAIGVFAFHAGFGDDVGHCRLLPNE
jgi:hypothetical protein